ncbi:MAG: transglutaminase family protein [Actinomycetota bacterium]
MRVSIDHTTVYRFDGPIGGALQELRLTPRDSAAQRVEAWDIDVAGGIEEVQFVDHHANRVTLISLDTGVEEAVVRCSGVVETSDTSGITAVHQGFAPKWLYRRSTDLTAAGPGVAALIERFAAVDVPDPISRAHALSTIVRDAVDYDQGWTHVATTAEDAIAAGHGVCQDHSHVFLAVARAMGLSARYVSGYLVVDDEPNQPATHAWVELWIEGLGWLGLDVSNRISPDDRYVRLATGLDYREAAPVSGIRFGDGEENLDVAVQIQQ